MFSLFIRTEFSEYSFNSFKSITGTHLKNYQVVLRIYIFHKAISILNATKCMNMQL